MIGISSSSTSSASPRLPPSTCTPNTSRNSSSEIAINSSDVASLLSAPPSINETRQVGQSQFDSSVPCICSPRKYMPTSHSVIFNHIHSTLPTTMKLI